MTYIEEVMPLESAIAFGLHPNAEVGFKQREADFFCRSLLSLQPHEQDNEGGSNPEGRAKLVLDDILTRLPEPFKLEEIRAAMEEPTPFAMVALQAESSPLFSL